MHTMLSGDGTCKWENGSHVLVTDCSPRCPSCFPADSHATRITTRLCFSSGNPRPRVRGPPNGPNGAFTEYRKINRLKKRVMFIQLHKMVKFSGLNYFRGSNDPPIGSHGLCGAGWVLCPRAQRATPRAGTPAAAGSLTVSGRKRVLSFHSFKHAKYGPRRPSGACFSYGMGVD